MRRYIYTAVMCLWAVAAALIFGNGGILRLHVIANSDSPYDQAVKLCVRDAILEYEAELGEVHSAGELKAMLLKDGGGLHRAAEAALQDAGADYGAELHIGEYQFPERDYGDRIYPAGEYQALRVVLGEGAGQNWWCVMFPPLCIAEDGAGEIEGEAKFESLILKLIREARQDEDPA